MSVRTGGCKHAWHHCGGQLWEDFSLFEAWENKIPRNLKRKEMQMVFTVPGSASRHTSTFRASDSRCCIFTSQLQFCSGLYNLSLHQLWGDGTSRHWAWPHQALLFRSQRALPTLGAQKLQTLILTPSGTTASWLRSYAASKARAPPKLCPTQVMVPTLYACVSLRKT